MTGSRARGLTETEDPQTLHTWEREVMQPLWKTVWEFLKWLNLVTPEYTNRPWQDHIEKWPTHSLRASLEGRLTPMSSNQ